MIRYRIADIFMNLLDIQKLSVQYYRHGQIIAAVRDVSLSIGPGESLGLVGESGSGKSTVALAILRLIRKQEGRITAGKILFEDRDLLTLPEPAMRGIRGRKIAMIFQDPFTSLDPVLTIRNQLEEVFTAHQFPYTGTDLERALDQVQLEPGRVLSSYPHQLSGGQRQRVCIAMALLGKPKLLLADEPTTALDVIVQKSILDLLFRLQQQLQLSLLLISHNLALVAQYTQRIAVMHNGRTVEEGPPQRLFQHPQEAYTRQLIEAIPRLPPAR